MKPNRKLKLQLLVQNGVFVVLLVGLAMAIVWVTKDVKTQWDLTQGQRNTLSQASIDVLSQLGGLGGRVSSNTNIVWNGTKVVC